MNKTVFAISAVATGISAFTAVIAASGAFTPEVITIAAGLSAAGSAVVTFLTKPFSE